jgi:hypothetical protein
VDTFGYIEQLSDAEQAEFDALDKTPLPAVLLKKYRTAASVGWTEDYVAKHSRWCPAQRMLRRMMIVALILLGAGLVFNVGAAIVARTVFERAIDQAVDKALHAHNVPHTEADKVLNTSIAQVDQ